MNFDNWKERIEEIKNNVHRMNCTIGSEGDREGYYYELIDTDYEWLFSFIEVQRKLIESFGRVTEGMTEDYQMLNERYDNLNKEYTKFKADVDKLYKYAHLSAKKSIEDKEKVINLLDTADDELQYASTTGDDSNREHYIKNAMRFIRESAELLK
ncbi:quinolinate synthase NadA [Bacillus sp. AFS040349]|uniref:quinolinate synthase NadA n=1 Tax=Bacillus sp. AFS040349 TaxID=2033502 RepID=UPI000BFE8A12|nr:quinolinate synthase NadA [Bacillus sp. AFS040349]PGT89199.1 hypothetical protein COD11_04150 [Bacillus sp. AFS040349]